MTERELVTQIYYAWRDRALSSDAAITWSTSASGESQFVVVSLCRVCCARVVSPPIDDSAYETAQDVAISHLESCLLEWWSRQW